ncbi:MAG: MFS transporter [Candidatus Entotheonellia bacterium]
MGHVALEPQKQAYRWLLLVSVCLIGFMTVGTRATLGNFFKTIIADLSWDRGTISFVVAVNLWISGLLQPFTGHVMDRFGARWLFVISVTVYGLGVALIGFTTNFAYLLVIYGIIVGAANAGSSMSLTNALLAQWFRNWRALAMSINNASAAIGQLVLVYISYLLLEASGWRPSHVYLGMAVLAVTIPMAFMVPRRGPQSSGPSGAAARLLPGQGPLETTSWSKALCSAPLWQLNGGYFVCGMTVSLFSVHLIPFATDRGLSPETAAKAFGLMAALSVVGSLLSGVLSDRIGRKDVLALAYLMRGGAFTLLLLWHHELALYVFAVIGGLSWLATPPSVIALTGEIYGLRALGTLGGISLLAHQIGGGASVWLAGVMHDLTGSYDLSFTIAAVALVGASLISFSIAERRYSVRYITPAPSAAGD